MIKLLFRLINDTNFKIAITALELLPQSFPLLDDKALKEIGAELVSENFLMLSNSKKVLRGLVLQNLIKLIKVIAHFFGLLARP